MMDQDESNEDMEMMNGDMYNYKGYFVKDDDDEEEEEEEETKFFEFGAHFPYSLLYQILDELATELKHDRSEENISSIHHKSQSQDIEPKKQVIKDFDQSLHSRNINNNSIINQQINLTNPLQSLSLLSQTKNDNEPIQKVLTSYVTKEKRNNQIIELISNKTNDKPQSANNKPITKTTNDTTLTMKHTNLLKPIFKSDLLINPKTKDLSVSYQHISKDLLTQSLNNLLKNSKNKIKNNPPVISLQQQNIQLISRNKSTQRKPGNTQNIISNSRNRDNNKLSNKATENKSHNVKSSKSTSRNKHSHKMSNDSYVLQYNLKQEKNANKNENPIVLNRQPNSAVNAFKKITSRNKNLHDILSSVGLSTKNKSRNIKNQTHQENHSNNNLSTTKDNQISDRQLNKTYVNKNNTMTRNQKPKIDNSNYLKFKTYLNIKFNKFEKNNAEMIDNIKKSMGLASFAEKTKEPSTHHSCSKGKTSNYKVNTINNSTKTNSGSNIHQKEQARSTTVKTVRYSKKIDQENPSVNNDKGINIKAFNENYERGPLTKKPFDFSNNYIRQFNKPVIYPKEQSKVTKGINLFNTQSNIRVLGNNTKNSTGSIKSKVSDREVLLSKH